MAVADGTILRIVASFLFPESVIAQNVFYAVFADTGTSDDEQDVIDDLAEWIEDAYTLLDGWIDSSVALTDIKVYNYDSGDGDWDELGDASIGLSFSGATDMLPHGVAYLLHAKSLDPDVQGGKFVGGFTEGAQVDGLWISAVNTVMGTFGAAWVTPFVGTITGADFAPGVWSVAQTNFRLFSGTLNLNAVPAYQRRRKPGVGI